MLLTPTKALAILAFASTTLGYYNDYYEHEQSNYAPQRQQYGGYHKQLRQQQLQAREALEEEYLDDLLEFIARQAPVKPTTSTSTSASASTTATTSATTSAATSASSKSTSTSATTTSGASATASAKPEVNKKKVEEDNKKKHEMQEKIKKEREHVHHADSKIKHYTHIKHKHQEVIKKMEEHVKKIDEDLKKQNSPQGQLPKRWIEEILAEWDI